MISERRGILLAGGKGTRLYPSTVAVNKHLLHVYNKPMIYYSLSILMLSGIQDILLITTEEALPSFKSLLGTGEKFGINISYKIQNEANGIAEAYLLAEDFLEEKASCLVLGDNFLYGHGLRRLLKNATDENASTIFCYFVKNNSEYGIVTLDKNNIPINVVEKPLNSESNLAITGVYFLDKDAPKYAKTLSPSNRGELEMVDLLRIYIQENKLQVNVLSRGFSWLDLGSYESLLNAASFIHSLEERQKFQVSCPEEIAFLQDWISKDELEKTIEYFGRNTEYGKYLLDIYKYNKNNI